MFSGCVSTSRHHRLIICKLQCHNPSTSNLYLLHSILYSFSGKLLNIDIKIVAARAVGILVSHLCKPFLVPCTLHPFLFASSAPCTSFPSNFCLSNLFPSSSMKITDFSS